MSDVKLLPCPFCGGEIKLDEDDFYMFCCDTCGAGITFAHELEDGTAEDCTKEESIESWNTRKPMERIVEQLEEKTELAYNRYMDCPSYSPAFARYQTQYQERQMCLDIVKRGGKDE